MTPAAQLEISSANVPAHVVVLPKHRTHCYCTGVPRTRSWYEYIAPQQDVCLLQDEVHLSATHVLNKYSRPKPQK